MNEHVFRAILAMDSYNRGYGANVNGVVGTQIGNATFVTDSTALLGLAQTSAAGFYASAYDWNGQSVISYRGTNPNFGGSLTEFLSSPGVLDVWYGWTLGAGFGQAKQGEFAIDFYKAVSGADSIYSYYATTGNSTLLLGHSLGGGLAGFVGSFTGDVSYGYDHMPFGIAAYAQAIADSVAAALDQIGVDISLVEAALGSGNPLTTIITGVLTLQDFVDAFDTEFTNRRPALATNGIHISGEALSFVRDGTAQVAIGGVLGSLGLFIGGPVLGLILGTAGVALGLGTVDFENEPGMSSQSLLTYTDILGPVERHSMPLMATLLYGENQWASEGGAGREFDWKAAAPFVFNALFDEEIGPGLQRVQSSTGGGTGAADPTAQVATAIAYSAINEGTRVFGDTGIRAMFDDASDLGKAIDPSGGGPASLTVAGMGIGGIIVEFAGLLAVNSVLQTANPNAINGILSTKTIRATGAQTLFIDLRPETWTIGGAAHEITQKDELIAGFIDGGGNGEIILSAIETWSAANGLGSVVNNVDRVSIAMTGNQPLAKLPGTGVLLSILSDSNTVASYNAATNFVIVGIGDDTLSGLGGSDILIGGAGQDQLEGGAASDFLYGGSGGDTLLGGNGHDVLYSGTSDTEDYLYGDAGRDLLVFSGGYGFAAGGLGNDTIDTRSSEGVTVQYALGDGRDTLEDSYDFDIGTLRFDNLYERNLACRGYNVAIDFTDISGSGIYIVWNVTIVDQVTYDYDQTQDELLQGDMSVFTTDGTKIMDLGNVVGVRNSYLGNGSIRGFNLANAPDLLFTNGNFSVGEGPAQIGGENADFRVIEAGSMQAQSASVEPMPLTDADISTPALMAASLYGTVPDAQTLDHRDTRSLVWSEQFDTVRGASNANRAAFVAALQADRQTPADRWLGFGFDLPHNVDPFDYYSSAGTFAEATDGVDATGARDNLTSETVSNRPRISASTSADRLLAIITQDMASFGAQGGDDGRSWRREGTGRPVEFFA